MIDLRSVSLALAFIWIGTWTPDQTIKLIGVIEIPLLCAIALVVGRAKVSRLLDAIIKLLEGPVKFDGFGIKFETLPPEEFRGIKGDLPPEEFRGAKGDVVWQRFRPRSNAGPPWLLRNVPERYRKLEVVKQRREPPSEGGDKEGE